MLVERVFQLQINVNMVIELVGGYSSLSFSYGGKTLECN